MSILLKIISSIAGILIIFNSFGTPITGNDTAVIKSYVKLAVELRPTDRDSSLSLLNKALTLSRKINYDKAISTCYWNLGNLYTFYGEARQAIHYYKINVDYLLQSKNVLLQEPLYLLYHNIGTMYMLLDMPEEASKYLYLSLNTAEKTITIEDIENPYNNIRLQSIINTCNNLVIVLEHGKQPIPSSYYTNKALWLSTLIKYPEGEVSALTNKSQISSDMHKTQAAEKYIKTALDICKRKKLKRQEGPALCKMGELLLSSSPERSIEYFDQAKLLLPYNPIYEAELYHYYAKAYLQLGDLDNAEFFAQKLRGYSLAHNARGGIGNAANILSEIHAKQKKYKEAFEERELSALLQDSITQEEKKSKLEYLDIQYRTSEKDRKIILDKLFIAQQQNRLIHKNILIGIISVGILILIIAFIIFSIYNKRVYNERLSTIKQKEEMNNLLSVIKGEEKERSRLARELHDGIGGLLSTTRMYFGNLQKKEPVLTKSNDYNEAIMLLDETIIEVRKTAHNLMPEMLFNLGLPEAVRSFCSSVQKANNIKVQFQYFGVIERLNRSFELFVYRIIQELLQNIIKHANANDVLVQLSKHDRMLSITVEDNGVGMSGETNSEGMGLRLIKTRINEFNGQMNINSNAGTGTSVYIELDLDEQKEHV